MDFGVTTQILDYLGYVNTLKSLIADTLWKKMIEIIQFATMLFITPYPPELIVPVQNEYYIGRSDYTLWGDGVHCDCCNGIYRVCYNFGDFKPSNWKCWYEDCPIGQPFKNYKVK